MSDDQEKLLTLQKRECEADGIFFSRYFFKRTFSTSMIVNLHHELMQKALDRTMLPLDHNDHINRLIITIPPGYTKTEMAVINYIARGLALNPQARFLHLSYSSNLALQNSFRVRDIVKSKAYQEMWPLQIKDDADSKQLWWTDSMGGVYATALGGQVTGMRAGHMDKTRFTGALICDDPLKPDDANYETRREAANQRFNETVASRLAVENIPIIVIMQRLHYNDLVGYLLRGGSGEKWQHLDLPVIIDHTKEYPEEYTHGVPIPHELPDGWLWPFKHSEKHEVALRSHRRKFAAQYMQRPIKRDEEFALWTEEMLKQAHSEPHTSPVIRTVVAVDPAASNTKTSDEHGVIVASMHEETHQYTVEDDFTRKGTPMDWANAAIKAYDQYSADAIVIETNQGGDMVESTLRNAGFKGRIIRVHASKGKVARAEPIAALYEQGMVKHKPTTRLAKLEEEMVDFDGQTGLSDGKSPNRVDACVWALTQLSEGVEMSKLLKLVVNR